LTQPGNGVAYSIQAPGPHGSGYRDHTGQAIGICLYNKQHANHTK